MSVKATWDEVLVWAKREIEDARTALETAKPEEVLPLQARIKAMRDLQVINEIPAAPEMVPQIPYT